MEVGQTPLTLGIDQYASPGDSFRFTPPKPDKTYVITVEPKFAEIKIDVCRMGLDEVAVARSDVGSPWVRFKLGNDPVKVSVTGATSPYKIKIVESWYNWVKPVVEVVPSIIVPRIFKGEEKP